MGGCEIFVRIERLPLGQKL